MEQETLQIVRILPRAINIDRGWKFQRKPFSFPDELSGKNTAREVNLPHDYMLEEDVCKNAPAAAAMGYYDGSVAYYSKTLFIPAEWKDEKVFLHFDGVMMNAILEVNGCQALLHHYGYTPFQADITPYIFPGEDNRIVVSVNPSMQPNSRWYTGAGIFRSVELVHTPLIHIANDGIFTYTKRIEYQENRPMEAYLCSEVTVCNDTSAARLVKVNVSLIPDGTNEAILTRSAAIQVNAADTATAVVPMTLPETAYRTPLSPSRPVSPEAAPWQALAPPTPSQRRITPQVPSARSRDALWL